MKAALPGRLAIGDQSSAVKMPSTLPRPTWAGKFTGSEASFGMNRIFGLNFCCTKSLMVS